MRFGETFAARSVKGALTRAAVAWILITPAVVAAKIWGSAGAAVILGVVEVAIYIPVALRFRPRDRQPSVT
jgi:hypothetical protein